MRTLRIFDRDALIRELRDVTSTLVTPPGALVVRVAGEGALCVFVCAPGAWTRVEEYAGEPDAPVPPVVPGAQDTPEPAEHISLHRDGESALTGMDELMSAVAHPSDAQLVHEALKIVCICDELRCPVVLNPASAAEKRWWQNRQRMQVRDGRPPTPEPMQQCVYDLGHTDDHEWREGAWVYGAHNHHPKCPRYPALYNTPPRTSRHAEGQPRSAAGATATMARPYISGSPVGRPVGILPDDPQGYLYSRAGNSGPGMPLPELPYHRPARDNWTHCAVYAPGYPAKDVWCEKIHRHDGGHEARSGTDRVRW